MSSDSITAAGVATISEAGDVLAVWYPDPTSSDPSNAIEDTVGEDQIRRVTTEIVVTTLDPAKPTNHAADAYLRLHLLSHRVFRPHEILMDGIFGVLKNVAWTTLGPCLPEEVSAARTAATTRGHYLGVNGVDKFPRMTDFVIPSGVRIADANRVRLGAYLGEGTTVMHEGFVNFNAGTLGTSMVEGRISAGVVVGNGSDIGGGASIMGTLSGGGSEVISIGEACLLGANSGLGISLGNDCVIEAGLYLTAGTVVTLPDDETTKGRALSGVNGMLFRRNSLNGKVEAIPKTGSWGGLNAALHDN